MIITGDSKEKLKDIASDSVDMVFTDPPYGWGFMSGTINWDKVLPDAGIWKECLRVLKPGCFAFIMSGTRADCLWRIMRDIEEAGFEIGFTINLWLYKCLSDDTEIYTNRGWKRFYELNEEEEILCYESDTGKFIFDKPIEWNIYKIKDTCYRIVSDNTDQIVTGKHSVIVEREGNLLCEFAEGLSTEETIPILEIMPNLSDANIFEERKENLFNGLPTNILDEICCPENSQAEQKNNNKGMSGLRENVSSLELSIEERGREVLLKTMQWEDEGNTGSRIQQEKSDNSYRGNKTEISGTMARGQKSFLEGWSNLLQEEGQLQKHQICQMSNGIQGNEQKGWVCNGTQDSCGGENWKDIKKNRDSPSYRSRSNKQQHFESDVICNQFGSQEIRKWTGYKTTLARVEKIEYEGNVFCPTTNTGFFIARRNGKMFITGNSGFPKAMNIGKKIDQKLGCEREVVGKYQRPDGTLRPNIEKWNNFDSCNFKGWDHSKNITSPSSPLAQKMEGSFGGYQPKPAGENLIPCYKPLSNNDLFVIIISQTLMLFDEVIRCLNVSSVEQYLNLNEEAKDSFVQTNVISNGKQNPLKQKSVRPVEKNLSTKRKNGKESSAQENVLMDILRESIMEAGKVGGGKERTVILKSILEPLMEKQYTNLNTEQLWKVLLAGLLQRRNKFTIEMKNEMIIGLKTLNSLLSQVISVNIIPVKEMNQNGEQLNVCDVETLLINSKQLFENILSIIAQRNVSTDIAKSLLYAEIVENLLKSLNTMRTEGFSVANHAITNLKQKEFNSEIIITAMKPLTESGYLAQAMKDGKGVSWLDDCRVPHNGDNLSGGQCSGSFGNTEGWDRPWKHDKTLKDEKIRQYKANVAKSEDKGRFPANILVSDEAIEAHKYFSLDRWFEGNVLDIPKASKREKNEGCEGMELRECQPAGLVGCINNGQERARERRQNFHPTCKPVKLPCYFITLGTRPGDVILDPFMGSGTTGVAAAMLNRDFIGIELNPEYVKIAEARIAYQEDRQNREPEIPLMFDDI